MRTYATGMTWGEGPRWHDGALWLSDTQGRRLWTDAGGAWTATPLESVSNGLWFLPDGRLTGAMMDEKRIGVWDGGRWQTYADLAPLGVGPLGDLVGDAAGNLYVDDVAFAAARGESPRPGRIILVRADGTTAVAAEDVEFPNGLAFLDGGATLVVAETSRQRLTAFRVAADGTLHDRRTYADIARLVGPEARPDGIWPAGDGVWVATTTGQVVARVREGELAESIGTSPGFPIACCLDDRGRLLATVADTGGEPLFAALARKAVTTTAVLLDPPPHR
ncbi:gluconolactonase [Sphaerisporangium krabiense]|uniref:Sugar lactone lactonase YvrE n=1 Tax=Sphaerisporangium krabiense TaxID=763782 RepID=A0A7W8ZCL0_9ACTN|nr:SMP-30/gluconolactonase/LRE family protein [Sphaerisporangium krabiense]MBB5631546.1 sugar lactone lactonase YvrE [Sphaerisporangium krabiense]GII60960.1 gluconolactonase [Sphaerisporangium krabiense]